jgi:hypothetical protein
VAVRTARAVRAIASPDDIAQALNNQDGSPDGSPAISIWSNIRK